MAGFKGVKVLAALCLSLAVSVSTASASASGPGLPAGGSGGDDPLPACIINTPAPTHASGSTEAFIQASMSCNQRLLPERFDFALRLQSKFNGVFKNVPKQGCTGSNVRVNTSPWLLCATATVLRQGRHTYRTRTKVTRVATGVSEVAVSDIVVIDNPPPTGS